MPFRVYCLSSQTSCISQRLLPIGGPGLFSQPKCKGDTKSNLPDVLPLAILILPHELILRWVSSQRDVVLTLWDNIQYFYNLCYCSLRFSNSWTTRCLLPILLTRFHIDCLFTTSSDANELSHTWTLEQMRRFELPLSAWKADVLTIEHYICKLLHFKIAVSDYYWRRVWDSNSGTVARRHVSSVLV